MHLSLVSHLGWLHVGFALTFLAFISTASQFLQLHIGASIAIAALRCIAQLTMGIVLQHVLVTKKLWAVAEITCTFFLPPPWHFIVSSSAPSRPMLTHPSVSDHPQYGRNWCVLPIGCCNPSHVITWPKVVIKATRRFRHMVSVCARRLLPTSAAQIEAPSSRLSITAGRCRCLVLV